MSPTDASRTSFLIMGSRSSPTMVILPLCTRSMLLVVTEAISYICCTDYLPFNQCESSQYLLMLTKTSLRWGVDTKTPNVCSEGLSSKILYEVCSSMTRYLICIILVKLPSPKAICKSMYHLVHTISLETPYIGSSYCTIASSENYNFLYVF